MQASAHWSKAGRSLPLGILGEKGARTTESSLRVILVHQEADLAKTWQEFSSCWGRWPSEYGIMRQLKQTEEFKRGGKSVSQETKRALGLQMPGLASQVFISWATGSTTQPRWVEIAPKGLRRKGSLKSIVFKEQIIGITRLLPLWLSVILVIWEARWLPKSLITLLLKSWV